MVPPLILTTYLEDMSKSIVLLSFPHYFVDYSKALDKLKRALCIIIEFMFMFSYLHWFEMPAQTYDKLLHASRIRIIEWHLE